MYNPGLIYRLTMVLTSLPENSQFLENFIKCIKVDKFNLSFTYDTKEQGGKIIHKKSMSLPLIAGGLFVFIPRQKPPRNLVALFNMKNLFLSKSSNLHIQNKYKDI